MKGSRLLPLLVIALLSTSCRLFDAQRLCTLNLVYGLSVQVKDSVTGAWAASGAKLVARADTYVDSMSFPAGRPDMDSRSLLGAAEHAGLYTVTVTKPGYRDWVKTGVRVTADECHVNQTELTALIQPAR
jgi:hypothetical protein